MYKIDYSNIKKKMIRDLPGPIISIIMVLFWKDGFSVGRGFEFIKIEQMLFVVFFLFLFVTSAKVLIDDLNRLTSYLILEKKGTVIKGLKYTLIESEYSIGGEQITESYDHLKDRHPSREKIIYLKANVECILPDGSTIMLESEPLFDRTSNYPDKIDIIIDLDNLTNYYVGFDIPENNSKEKKNEKI